MQTILLSILLNVFHPTPHLFTQKKIDVNFKLDHILPGKPTLVQYYYDVTIKNNEDLTWYIGIPKHFNDTIQRKDNISAAEYLSFGDAKGIALYTKASFVIFQVQPGQQLFIDNFMITTFDEKISSMITTNLTYVVFNRISVGGMTLPDFMGNESLHDDNLEYLLTLAYGEDVQVNVKK